jgi:hypothetical protein
VGEGRQGEWMRGREREEATGTRDEDSDTRDVAYINGLVSI